MFWIQIFDSFNKYYKHILKLERSEFYGLGKNHFKVFLLYLTNLLIHGLYTKELGILLGILSNQTSKVLPN